MRGGIRWRVVEVVVQERRLVRVRRESEAANETECLGGNAAAAAAADV